MKTYGVHVFWFDRGILLALVMGVSVASAACSSNTAGPSGASGGTAGTTPNSAATGGSISSADGTAAAGVGGTTGANGTGGTMAMGGSATIEGGSRSSGGSASIVGGTTSTGGTTSGTGGNTSAGGTASSVGGLASMGGTMGGMTSGAGGTTPGKGGTTSTGGITGGTTSGTAGTTSGKGGAIAMGGTTSKGGSTAIGGTTGAGGTTYNTSAVTTTCPGAVPAGITSSFCSCVNEGPGYSTSGFSVANNVWGSGAGPECVWATTSTLWGFASNHPQTGGVKCYPNIGLSPRKLISSINTYTSSFDITVPGNVGVWEAAYDIWLRTPGGGNTRIELMVWMYTYKAGPISSIVASTKPTIGDYTWTVHYGSNGSNATISFVSNTNVTSGTVDIKAILDWLIANNTTQYGQFTTAWTLDQVQWGWEISSDGGSTQEFINNSFSVSSS